MTRIEEVGNRAIEKASLTQQSVPAMQKEKNKGGRPAMRPEDKRGRIAKQVRHAGIKRQKTEPTASGRLAILEEYERLASQPGCSYAKARKVLRQSLHCGEDFLNLLEEKGEDI
jgi:hypothetical protein